MTVHLHNYKRRLSDSNADAHIDISLLMSSGLKHAVFVQCDFSKKMLGDLGRRTASS